MKEIDKQKIWEQLGGNPKSPYLTTQRKQIRVSNLENDENQIYSPVIYQSCMTPEDIHIYELRVQQLTDMKWKLDTHYETKIIDLKKSYLEVSDWEAKIHKVDCK